jgi:hypothetical protein
VEPPLSQSSTPSTRGDDRTTRVSFLRRTGKTLAIGLGLALVPISSAYAQNGSCCPEACRVDCTFPNRPYRCNGCSSTCCLCIFHDPYECFTLPCPCG